MTNGKSAKRQRQKEMRRAKMEEEVKRMQGARRRRRIIFLVLLALVAAGVALATSERGSEDRERPDRAAGREGCTRRKPPGGNTETPSSPPPMTIDPVKEYIAVFDTSCGTIEAELAADISPNAVNSFVYLARQRFYDGLTFHRIVKDFAVQGGDPKGDGTGGPNYKTVDPPPSDYKYEKGTIAMAKAGPEPAGTAGSQFFFVPAEGASLSPDYAVLGRVVKGEDILERLNNLPTESGSSGERSSPRDPVYIETVRIRERANSPGI